MIFRISYSLFAFAAAATLSSCALLQPPEAATQDDFIRQSFAPRKVVQVGFGRDAVFASCVEPACPETTRKTLATMQEALTAPVTVRAQPVDDDAARLQALPATPARPVAAQMPAAQHPALVIQFPFDDATLTATAKAALDELIPIASKAERITIAGRTDNSGSETANQAVALARANAVRDYLRAKLPVPDEVLMIDVQGSCCYVASNDTVEGRKQNRRVEIVLSVPKQVAQ